MKTKPKHWLDYVLWPILKIIWEPFSVKQSHFWHWRRSDYNKVKERAKNIKLLFAPGLASAKPRDTFLSNLWQTNFAWKKVWILDPVNYKGQYQVGFYEPATDKCQICSVVLKGLTGVLIGHNNVKFFAFDLNGQIIELKKVTETDRAEISLLAIPLI